MKISLLTNGAVLATAEVLAGGSIEGAPEVETLGDGDEPDWNGLARRLREVTDGFAIPKPQTSDAEAAIAVREALTLTRREAAEDKLWHFASVIHALDYVRWRWGKEDGSLPRERLLGPWRRNAIGRLWWLAELTRDVADEDCYRLTKLAVIRQEFSLWCLDVMVSSDLEVVRHLVETAYGGERPFRDLEIREAFKNLTGCRATHVLDTLSPAEKSAVVRRLAGPGGRTTDEREEEAE